MNLLRLLWSAAPLLLLLICAGMTFATFAQSEELFNLTAAASPTSTGGSFEGPIRCIKDANETNAYCSTSSKYSCVKLTLNPIAFSSEIYDGVVFSFALYESDTTSRVFYNDVGTIKFVDTSSFSTPSTVVTTGYTFESSVGMVTDNTNKILFVTDFADVAAGDKIIKITDLDAGGTPTATSHIALSGSGDKGAMDLILANDDLYVALAGSYPARIARVVDASTSSPSYTKTVDVSDSIVTIEFSYYSPCLYYASGHNFVYALGKDHGRIAKFSIGSSDADFARVSISDAIDSSNNIASRSFVATPDASHLFILCRDISKVYIFNIATMSYINVAPTVVAEVTGGVATSDGRVAFGTYGDSTFHHFEFPLLSTTSTIAPASSSSLTSNQALKAALALACMLSSFLF